MTTEEDIDNKTDSQSGMLAPGTMLGDFRIIKYLACGSMGRVYLAEQVTLGREVAIKVFSRVLTPDPDARDQFLREIRLAAKLDHPNIVRVYDAGREGDYLFLAMKYVDEKDLGELLAEYPRIDENDALFIAGEIAKALDYAWEEFGLIHRDIKPSNIKLNKAIEPHLLDFGISTSREQKCALAEQGYVIGTPEYVSPEQATGREELDFRSDVYSLGATLYHMVTGSRPFQAKEPEQLLRQQMTATLEPPAKRNPKVSQKVSDLIVTMMAKDRKERPASWQAVIEAIAAAAKKAPDLPAADDSAPAVEGTAQKQKQESPSTVESADEKAKSSPPEAPTALEPASLKEEPEATPEDKLSVLPWVIAAALAVVAVILLVVILGG